MSKVLITRSKLDDLAVAVSAKSGATLPLTIAQMQTAVEGIQPGGTLVTKSITQNGTYDAEDDNADGYSSVTVNVSSGGSTYSLTNIVPTQTVATTTSNLYGYVGLIPSYTAYVQSGEWYLVTYDSNEYVVTGYYGANSEILVGDYQLITSNVEWLETPFMVEHNLTNGYFFLGSRVSGNHTLKVDKITFLNSGVTLINKSITANGTYNASSDSADGYSSVTVNVPGSSPNLQAKTNISPTTSSQTITADSGYDGLSSVQINAMPSMSLPTAASASSSGTSKATITPGSSAQYLNIPTGYNAAAAYYTIAASGGGSVQTDTKTATGADYQTSMSFSSMKGEPKMFTLRLNAQVSSSGSTTYYYIVDITSFGSTTHGNCFRVGSTRRVDNITSGYSWSYSGTTLTISSSAASRSASPGAFYNGSYELLYVY